MPVKILLAEDDPAASRLLVRFLTLKGFDVLAVSDGLQAIDAFITYDPQLVVLDVEMPRLDGWSVLRQIRSMSDVPVIMVTVRDGTKDKVKGLTSGADDYVTKPFDIVEIEARIQAVLRRYNTTKKRDDIIEVGPLLINDEAKEVRLRGTIISLTPKEYELLRLLARHPGRVYSQEEIIEAVWPERSHETASEEVKKYVYLLRNKFKSSQNRGDENLIETVRGFGYKLAPH